MSEKTIDAKQYGIIKRIMMKLSSGASFCVCGAINIYRFAVSPFFAPCCRFHPTCSGYAREAFIRHGFLKGLFLSTWRFLRCHPWSGKHWHDPVPKHFAWREIFGYNRIGTDKIK